MEEENVFFVGAKDHDEQANAIRAGRVFIPNVVFMEGAFHGAPFFRSVFPRAKIVHVGQNIDRQGLAQRPNPFTFYREIDLYAFVGAGQYAEYCVKIPRLRHKFVYLPNVVPWESIHSKVRRAEVEDVVAWIGAWSKLGLRAWVQSMEKVLSERPTYRWELYGPSYGIGAPGFPVDIFYGSAIPADRVSIHSEPIDRLLERIARARVVLVSLGGETGAISALDGHAMGRPVLSGNDLAYKYANPEGTGIRTTTGYQRCRALSYLLDNPEICDSLGLLGRAMVLRDYIEVNQRQALEAILIALPLLAELGDIAHNRPRSALVKDLLNFLEKVRRRAVEIRLQRWA